MAAKRGTPGKRAKVVRSAGSKKVKFHYIKSEQKTTVYADGGYGGVTPRGMISLAFYNERLPIPQEEDADVSPEGQIVATTKTKTREGIIRQIDCEVFMTPTTARSIGEWLIERASRADAATKANKSKVAKRKRR